MRKILFLLLFVFVFMSCEHSKKINKVEYLYKWKIDVTYDNGDKEIIDCEFKSRHNSEIKLSTSDGSACIVIIGLVDYKTVCCGVRKFNIISEEKIPANK